MPNPWNEVSFTSKKQFWSQWKDFKLMKLILCHVRRKCWKSPGQRKYMSLKFIIRKYIRICINSPFCTEGQNTQNKDRLNQDNLFWLMRLSPDTSTSSTVTYTDMDSSYPTIAEHASRCESLFNKYSDNIAEFSIQLSGWPVVSVWLVDGGYDSPCSGKCLPRLPITKQPQSSAVSTNF
jgi:hypothetical protein